jgi:hypothetical protein
MCHKCSDRQIIFLVSKAQWHSDIWVPCDASDYCKHSAFTKWRILQRIRDNSVGVAKSYEVGAGRRGFDSWMSKIFGPTSDPILARSSTTIMDSIFSMEVQ